MHIARVESDQSAKMKTLRPVKEKDYPKDPIMNERLAAGLSIGRLLRPADKVDSYQADDYSRALLS